MSDFVFDAWRINCEVTRLLVRGLPSEVWRLPLPASPRRTLGSLATHLHNTRCLWLKSLGLSRDAAFPARVAARSASCSQVLGALSVSDRAIEDLLRVGLEAGGRFPGPRGAFVFGAIPRETSLFVAYAISHESHHRGQLVLAARQLGFPLRRDVVAGLWQWSSRLRDSTPGAR